MIIVFGTVALNSRLAMMILFILGILRIISGFRALRKLDVEYSKPHLA